MLCKSDKPSIISYTLNGECSCNVKYKLIPLPSPDTLSPCRSPPLHYPCHRCPALPLTCPAWQARAKQIDRLTREEKLGALQVQLASGKLLSLATLRGSARAVIVAGSPDQVTGCYTGSRSN